jgi:Zn finger protein HypA/HybF involved in hydrogenase expression
MLTPHQGIIMTRFIYDNEEDTCICENCKAEHSEIVNEYGEFYWLFCPVCGKKITEIVEDEDEDEDEEE